MNSKKTNRLILILNIMTMLALIVLFFLNKGKILLSAGNGSITVSFSDDKILDIFIGKLALITSILLAVAGWINILAAVQNKNNKKISFWMVSFGISILWRLIYFYILEYVYTYEIDVFLKWFIKFMYGIIPIAIIAKQFREIILLKRKTKNIQIISYVLSAILSILFLFNVMPAIWEFISLLMQLIYIHYQNSDIIETKKRKIINILIYRIFYFIIILSFYFMMVYSTIYSLIYSIGWNNQLKQLDAIIYNLEGITTDNILIPIVNNNKYGYIDESGKEIIPCEYDKVSFFFKKTIYNKDCYFAFVQKNDNFYIISKENKKINVTDSIYLQNTCRSLELILDEDPKKATQYYMYLNFATFTVGGTKHEPELHQQFIGDNRAMYNSIVLQCTDSNYYYKMKNYELYIEPTIHNEELNNKYVVTIKKNNGEEYKDIVYLPDLYIDEEENIVTIDIYNNKYLIFKTSDESQYGIYDENGDKTIFKSDYYIRDIENDLIILIEEKSQKYFIINKANEKLLDALKTYFILENETIIGVYDENKMILYDLNFNPISNRYDGILYNLLIDYMIKTNSYLT